MGGSLPVVCTRLLKEMKKIPRILHQMAVTAGILILAF
jgi:hypothetical protein